MQLAITEDKPVISACLWWFLLFQLVINVEIRTTAATAGRGRGNVTGIEPGCPPTVQRHVGLADR